MTHMGDNRMNQIRLVKLWDLSHWSTAAP